MESWWSALWGGIYLCMRTIAIAAIISVPAFVVSHLTGFIPLDALLVELGLANWGKLDDVEVVHLNSGSGASRSLT